MTIHLPYNNASFQATANVMWVCEIARHGDTQYEVGVRFEWVEDLDRRRLVRYFDSVMSGRR